MWLLQQKKPKWAQARNQVLGADVVYDVLERVGEKGRKAFISSLKYAHSPTTAAKIFPNGALIRYFYDEAAMPGDPYLGAKEGRLQGLPDHKFTCV